MFFRNVNCFLNVVAVLVIGCEQPADLPVRPESIEVSGNVENPNPNPVIEPESVLPELLDLQGNLSRISSFGKNVVAIPARTGCPVGNRYAPTIAKLR